MREGKPDRGPAGGHRRDGERTGRGRHEERGGRADRDSRRRGAAGLFALAEALLMAAVSPVLPGLAHLRAGRIRLGGRCSARRRRC
ncbi:hypothetical protein [Actinomadura sp. WMMB 499]|uniref:hypothetical protein n=1 Tax=Actinomadura sp. WMMB 499 TaxID=1219491 RepID=UPI0012473065|nr:hypothetical protein [Actinomadura sp. WMMB 499]QFG26490.1 hypothetical protein F7P10_40495 [Actinomadura sp. WMMB 499]